MTVFNIFLVLNDLGNFEEHRSAIYRLSLNWDLSDDFIIIKLGFLKKNHRGKVPFSSNLIKNTPLS